MKQLWLTGAMLGLMFSLVACPGGGTPNPPPPAGGANTVAGLVTDIGSGARLSGVTVSLRGSSRSVVTDSTGEFLFDNLAAGTVNFSFQKTKFAPGYATAESAASAQTVLVALKKEGAKQNYDPSQTKTLSERTEAGPYAVIFTPNSLDSSDPNLKISITPVDPIKELSALPGQLVTGGTTASALDAVTFAEFSILDSSGKKVNLKASANAIVELPIPASLRASYPLGAKIHCYSYNPDTGKWEDFVEGTVSTSSVDNTTPVLRAQIRHFSWYGGAPQVKDQRCYKMQIISKVTGKPLEGAVVNAKPGLSAVSDANGFVQVTGGKGAGKSFSNFSASKTYTDTYVDNNGNLIPQKGAKVIEIGYATYEEDDLAYLNPPYTDGPCPAGKISTKAGESRITITTSLAPKGVYKALGLLSSDSIIMTLQVGFPDPQGDLIDETPASGAVIKLSDGPNTVQLVEAAPNSGYYSLAPSSTFKIVGGKRYALSIDGDGNGSIEGGGSADMIGDIAWNGIVAAGEYTAAGFTPAWTDSASSTPGYSPIYFVQASSSAGLGSATTSALSVLLNGIDLSNPQAGLGTLPVGSYQLSLNAFSGGFQGGLAGNITVSDNLTGIGLQGQLISFKSLAPISISLK